jgi:hypothetical protein
MLQVGFEHMIPVFERAKTVRALEGAATVIGTTHYILKYTEFVPNQNVVVPLSGMPLVRLTCLLRFNALINNPA